MNPRCLPIVLGVSLFATACGKKSEHAGANHSAPGHEHGAVAGEKVAAPEVTLKPGAGLTISPDIRAVLGLVTAPSEERVMPPKLGVSALVFKAGPPALANITLATAEANALAARPLPGSHLVSRTPHGPSPESPVDLVFALDDHPAAKPGDFIGITLALADSPAGVAVPRSALLRTVGGTFVYVVNGGAYLRTTVVAGAESAGFIAISDGLYAGVEVVTHPVQQLWLMELHLAQGGGGHSR